MNIDHITQALGCTPIELCHTVTRARPLLKFRLAKLGPSLVVESEGGICRLGSVMGWLSCMHSLYHPQGNTPHAEFHELAERMANSFISELHGLANYGGLDENSKPRFKVYLDCDFAMHSFSLGWHRLEAGDYVASMNGGLIYRGPGCGETFSVSLDSDPDRYWTVNT